MEDIQSSNRHSIILETPNSLAIKQEEYEHEDYYDQLKKKIFYIEKIYRGKYNKNKKKKF